MSEKKRIYVIFDHSADMLTFSEIKSSCNAEDCLFPAKWLDTAHICNL